jgi:hypothetical protein
MQERRYHCHQSKVALLFQVGFDELETSSCGLANRLDEEALADTKLDARIIWTQLSANQPEEPNIHFCEKTNAIDAQVHRLQQRVGVALFTSLDDKQHQAREQRGFLYAFRRRLDERECICEGRIGYASTTLSACAIKR